MLIILFQKDMILMKELSVMTSRPTDIVNDGAETASLAEQEYAKAVGARRAAARGRRQ